MSRVHHDYPYRLRIEHADRGELRLYRAGQTIVFDPAQAPAATDLVVLTGPSADRTRATAEAAKNGVLPEVISSLSIGQWLAKVGPIRAHEPPCVLDGVRFESMEYVPAVEPPRSQQVLSTMSALRPDRALRALRSRGSVPAGLPHIWRLTFPDGASLVHLDLALHQHTDAEWLRRAAQTFHGAEWLMLGCGYGQENWIAESVPPFGSKRVLVTELVNGERKARGLPTGLVTPLRDKLKEHGVEAHVFATQASYRFE